MTTHGKLSSTRLSQNFSIHHPKIMDKSLKNVLQGGYLNVSASVGKPEVYNPSSTVNSNQDYGGSMRDFSNEIMSKKTSMGFTNQQKGLHVHPAWIRTDTVAGSSQKQSKLLSRATSASVRNQ